MLGDPSWEDYDERPPDFRYPPIFALGADQGKRAALGIVAASHEAVTCGAITVPVTVRVRPRRS